MGKKMAGSDAIMVVVRAVLEPAMAGGMSEARAKAIYEEIMSSIASLGTLTTGLTAFETLRDDLLNKWAMHHMKGKNDRPV